MSDQQPHQRQIATIQTMRDGEPHCRTCGSRVGPIVVSDSWSCPKCATVMTTDYVVWRKEVVS